MIPDDREAHSGTRGNRLEIVAPAMLGIDRGPMIDQPELAMPEQEIRIARGAIDIGKECIEPDDVRGKLGGNTRANRSTERQGARQIVDPDVETWAPLQELLD